MTPEQLDQLALEVASQIRGEEINSPGEFVIKFARRYRKALAEKMEPVAWAHTLDYGKVGVSLSPANPDQVEGDIYVCTPLYSLEDWK